MKSSGWKANIWTLCPFLKMHLNYLHKKFKVKSFILGKQTFLNVSHNDFLFVYLLVSRWNRSTKTIRTLADTLWRAKSFPSKQTRFLLPERKRIDCFFMLHHDKRQKSRSKTMLGEILFKNVLWSECWVVQSVISAKFNYQWIN